MKTRALIDTDVLSYYFRGDKNVVKHFENYLNTYEQIEISIITYYEIISGLQAKNAFKQLETFEEFASDNLVIPLTENSCKISGEIYSILRHKGDVLDDIDLLIAGVAIENEMILVTNNEKHFQRIPDFKIENWTHRL